MPNAEPPFEVGDLVTTNYYDYDRLGVDAEIERKRVRRVTHIRKADCMNGGWEVRADDGDGGQVIPEWAGDPVEGKTSHVFDPPER